jgi:adenosine deaminase
MLNSDDPKMFHTDIAKEYVDFCGRNDYAPDVVRRLVHNGIEACWLDDSDKAGMHRSFDTELDTLETELEDRR